MGQYFRILVRFALVAFCSTICSASSKYEDTILTCGKGDNDCFRRSAQGVAIMFCDGVPELGIQPLDPLNLIRPLNTDVLTLKDGILTGMRDVIVDDAWWDIDSKQIGYKFHTNFLVKAKCVVDGMIEGKTIKGSGDIQIKIENAMFDTVFSPVLVLKEGYDYLKLEGDSKVKIAGETDFKFINFMDESNKPDLETLEILNKVRLPDYDTMARAVVEYSLIPLDDGLRKTFEVLPLKKFLQLDV